MKGSVNVFVFLTPLTLHRIILGCKCIILLDMFRYIRDFFAYPFSIYRLHFRSSRYIDVVYPLQTGSKAQWVDPFISKDTFSSSFNVASSFTSTNLFMTDFLSNFSLIFKTSQVSFLLPQKIHLLLVIHIIFPYKTYLFNFQSPLFSSYFFKLG